MRKERGGEVTWCFYAKEEVSVAQGRVQRCVFLFGAATQLPRTAVFHE